MPVVLRACWPRSPMPGRTAATTSSQSGHAAARAPRNRQRHTSLSASRPALDPAILDAAGRGLAAQYDPEFGGFGGAPKFPQPMAIEFLLRYCAAQRRRSRARRRGAHARPHGPRRHLRPAGRRVSSLQHRRRMAGAALRKDAVRQRPARARLPDGLPGHRQRVFSPGRRRSHRVRPARHDRPVGRLLLNRGRRLRRRGGRVLRLDAGRAAARCSASDDARLFGEFYDVKPRGNFEGRASILHVDDTPAEVARAAGRRRGRAAARARAGAPGPVRSPRTAGAASARRESARRLERA